MRRIALLAATVFGFACGGSSNSQTFNATMSQANEPVANRKITSTATGSAAVQIAGNTLTYSLRATGLTNPAIAAHIHLKNATNPDTTNGAVIVTFKTTPGATANSVSVDDQAPAAPGGPVPDATAKNTDGSPMTFDQLVQHIKNGDCYVNVHTGLNPPNATTQNTAGEIRGDLK
jgi:Cu/Zn superoxide dismutase